MRRACFARTARAGWEEKHRGGSQQVVVVGGFGQRPIDRICDGLQSGECRLSALRVRQGALQQSNDLVYVIGCALGRLPLDRALTRNRNVW